MNAMHVQAEDNQAAMAANFAAEMIVLRANAAGLEWVARPSAIRLELHTEGRAWYERRSNSLTATAQGEKVGEIDAIFAAKARNPGEAVEIRRGAMGGSNITLF